MTVRNARTHSGTMTMPTEPQSGGWKAVNARKDVFVVSRYSDYKKDDLAFEIDRFLEDHPISELLDVVSDCINKAEWLKETDMREQKKGER